MGFILSKLRSVLNQRAYSQQLAAAQLQALQMAQQQAYAQQQAFAQKNTAIGNQYAQALIASNQSLSNQTTYTNSTTHVSGVLSSTSAVSLSPGLYNNPVYPTQLGTQPRDVLFLSLKGMEESAIGDEDAISYDDDARDILDLRNFKEGQPVSLLRILSVCVANLTDPDGVISLLEGYGMTVEA